MVATEEALYKLCTLPLYFTNQPNSTTNKKGHGPHAPQPKLVNINREQKPQTHTQEETHRLVVKGWMVGEPRLNADSI